MLGPILNMPVSESKRQRVLVASSIIYSEVISRSTSMEAYDLHLTTHMYHGVIQVE